MSADQIEKDIVVYTPRDRVWRAITDHREFGKWFQAEMEGAFVPGARVKGKIRIPGFEHLALELQIERIEPRHLFSWRWHPYAIDPSQDYSQEPTTLVVFEFEEVPRGTRIKVRESGFDRIPPGRRREAFRMNTEGWESQLQNLDHYVSQAS